MLSGIIIIIIIIIIIGEAAHRRTANHFQESPLPPQKRKTRPRLFNFAYVLLHKGGLIFPPPFTWRSCPG